MKILEFNSFVQNFESDILNFLCSENLKNDFTIEEINIISDFITNYSFIAKLDYINFDDIWDIIEPLKKVVLTILSDKSKWDDSTAINSIDYDLVYYDYMEEDDGDEYDEDFYESWYPLWKKSIKKFLKKLLMILKHIKKEYYNSNKSIY